MQGEQIKMNNGIPEIIGVMMKSEDCNIIDTWHTIGMRATDSNDVEAQDVYVPEYLTYYLTPEFEANKYFKGALYQFPAIGASIASLIAPIALAVAKNAISELISISRRKVPFGSTVPVGEKSSVQRKIGMASGIVRSSEAYLYQTLVDAWEKTKNGEKLTLEEKGNMLLACTNTNQMCVQAVDLMYSAAGTSAIYTRSKLAQHFVNAQVIRQHGFSNDSRYETVAQILLGLQPDLPVVTF
jgi:alkylation response protein AidB-like acyl-CoA dehydrogenase